MGKVFLAIGMAAFAAVSIAVAHDHATGIVKERMDMMESMAKHMKAITERIKSKSDLAGIKVDAEAIAAHAPHMVHLFLKGSMQKPTEARATIWQNWEDFEAKARALEIESNKLAKTDASDFMAIEGRVRAVSQACGACHEKYRVKK
jgi:cytochrome c556